MTSQIWGLKKLFCIVSGYRSQMLIIHLQNKVIHYRAFQYFSPLGIKEFLLYLFFTFFTTLVSAVHLPCFPQRLHIVFLLHVVKMLSRCVYGGQKHKHGNILRANKCRLVPIWHTVKTHLSCIYNPLCVNQMITPYHKNLKFSANC